MVFSLIQNFPKIDNNLEVRYEYQENKNMIGVDKFQFNSSGFKLNCDFVEEFWIEKRNAIPVSEKNKWKCSYCEFRQICNNNVKTLENFSI